MSRKRTDTVTKASVVAITREENKLRGVELRKQGEVFEVIWTRDGEARETSLAFFASECDLPCGDAAKTRRGGEKIIAVGFDSSGVVFYRLGVPAVKDKELAAIVKLQTEARLPLPAEQMELAWRSRELQDGQVDVIVAAAKRDILQRFVEDVRDFRPNRILLDCEGVVKAWKELFLGDETTSVVMSIRSRTIRVCLAEEGRLVNAVSLDMGMGDFAVGPESAERIEVAERFVQDMRSVLGLFGCADFRELPIFVLSDGSSAIREIASTLQSAGLNVRVAMPQMGRLSGETELSAEDIYRYRVPIGLALMALEAEGEELNVFESLYQPRVKKERMRWLRSPKLAGAITTVMLALLVSSLYVMDVVSEKRLAKWVAEVDVGQFAKRQKLIKSVASQRPDLLRLLSEINSTEHDGIVLSVIHFKKGQLVSVQGQAGNEEQLWKFEKSLRTRKGIREPWIESETMKDEKRDFTITFHYGRFTEKKSLL